MVSDEVTVPQCLTDEDCPQPSGCVLGSCDPELETCGLKPAPDGTGCDDGNSCTIQDLCLQGSCKGSFRDCDDGNPCTVETCSEDLGCVVQVALGACDDGNVCTTEDRCDEGFCIGHAVDCSDGNPCTADRCDLGVGCLHEPIEGVPCDDGDGCTSPDLCIAGACTKGMARDCDDENVCTLDVCEPESGECTHEAAADIPCNDGDLCTQDDFCLAGECVPGPDRQCDDDNFCTDDLCEPAVGCIYVNNQDPCDDGLACTVGDRCASGSCSSGPQISCQDGNVCTLDSCDPGSGQCLHLQIDWPCDDGNACSKDDRCLEGLCQGAAVSCDDGNPCTADSCSPATGCVHLQLALPCNDGNACTSGDVCGAGSCIPGTVFKSCDDGNPCTTDVCVPSTGACLHEPGSGPCDDGDPCTVGDTCDGGACRAGSLEWCDCLDDSDCLPFVGDDLCKGFMLCDRSLAPFRCRLALNSVVHCEQPLNPCMMSQCNPETGMCESLSLADDTPCDSGSPCLFATHCQNGTCTGGEDVDCNDGNPCTEDWCDPFSGCSYVNLWATTCDDGNACTSGDRCIEGECRGTSKICEDGNPCTMGVCDPATGGCSTLNLPSSCNDGNPCTEMDSCADGVCQGTPVDCFDGNPCTQDGCELETGCRNVPVEGECDDGNLCTESDECANGHCTGVPLSCDDENPCTDDTCEPEIGCLHSFNVSPCNDGTLCTYADRCTEGICLGYPLSCEDGNPCTESICDPLVGCIFYDLLTVCTDNNYCTVGDLCVEGACQPGAVKNCDDSNPCTADFCDPANGVCRHTHQAVPCDDGSLCTTLDLCESGVCVGVPVSCDDDNECTSDACSETSGCTHEDIPNAPCFQWNLCVAESRCQEGVCQAVSWTECDDADGCTLDVCTPELGCEHVFQEGLSCDDTLPETIQDRCSEGACVGLSDGDADGVPETGDAAVCQGGQFADCSDNCPAVANSNQLDSDGDSIGDACEWCGPLQEIDGVSPPDLLLWEASPAGSCPDGEQDFQSLLVDNEPLFSAWSYRNPECSAGVADVVMVPNLSWSGRVTRVLLESSFSVMDCGNSGEPLAGVRFMDSEGHFVDLVDSFGVPGAATESCATPAVLDPVASRFVLTLEVDSTTGVLGWSMEGIPDSASSHSVEGWTAPFRLELWARGQSQNIGTPVAAEIRLYRFESLCF